MAGQMHFVVGRPVGGGVYFTPKRGFCSMQAGTRQAVETAGQAQRFVLTRRRVAWVSSVLVLVVAAGSAIWCWQQSYTSRAMRLLVRAFSDQRPIAGRLAGGFKGGRF